MSCLYLHMCVFMSAWVQVSLCWCLSGVCVWLLLAPGGMLRAHKAHSSTVYSNTITQRKQRHYWARVCVRMRDSSGNVWSDKEIGNFLFQKRQQNTFFIENSPTRAPSHPSSYTRELCNDSLHALHAQSCCHEYIHPFKMASDKTGRSIVCPNG